MKKVLISVGVLVAVIAAGLVYWFVFRKDLTDKIIFPYIAHQKPRIDPHVPSSNAIADKLDEPIFDGLFNVSANASGVTYEDGLGELVSYDDATKIAIVKLHPKKKWHSSYGVTMEKEKIAIASKEDVLFAARDLQFTMERIKKLGSLSPDYILISQAIKDFAFSGPNENDEIQLVFKSDRQWVDSDIKEVLSFKVIPANSEMEAVSYTVGSGPYLYCGEYEDNIFFHKVPDGPAQISNLLLRPFIDNSTYSIELRNRAINSMLSTPFGSVASILGDSAKFFHKSSIATTFFALLYNTQKLSLQQRHALRKLVNNEVILNRFFKVGTQQQRHIANYRGTGDNYQEYLNYSVFPTTSYYVEDSVVIPMRFDSTADFSSLPDTVRIQTCLNYDFKEELSDLVQTMNDPALFHGKIKVSAVGNDEIGKGEYDAVLVPVPNYRSNFLFDLYSVFMREPDFSTYKINLRTTVDEKGKGILDMGSVMADRNFFRLDPNQTSADQADIQQFLHYVYGFMSTSEIGDKQAYSKFIDELDQKLALGGWLFSLPSLAYFSRQFDASSIDMYGTASQLSTIEKWTESRKK